MQTASIKGAGGRSTASDMGGSTSNHQKAGSDVRRMIPELANHLMISSGGKRLRPMLTLAAAPDVRLCRGSHIKLATAVEFMHGDIAA